MAEARGARAVIEGQCVGRGGDSLGVGPDALWLTDYHRGTIARFRLAELVAR